MAVRRRDLHGHYRADACARGRVAGGGHAHQCRGREPPATRELDSAAVARCRIFVDAVDSASAEAGDLLIPLQEGRIAGPEQWTPLGAALRPVRCRLGEEECDLVEVSGETVEAVLEEGCAAHRQIERVVRRPGHVAREHGGVAANVPEAAWNECPVGHEEDRDRSPQKASTSTGTASSAPQFPSATATFRFDQEEDGRRPENRPGVSSRSSTMPFHLPPMRSSVTSIGQSAPVASGSSLPDR
jgi:hypothetical protein